MTDLKVDGYDLSTIGFRLTSDLSGWRDRYAADWASSVVPGRIGELLLASDPTIPARQVTLSAYQKAPDLATLLTYADALKWRLRPGQHEFILPDQGARILRARVKGPVQFSPVAPALAQKTHRIQIPLLCHDPRLLADADTVVAVTNAAGDVDLPLGTAPSSPSISVSVASFTLTYKDSAGATLYTLQVSGASATPVVIDMTARTVTSSAGSEVDAIVSPRFFDLDPGDGDFLAAAWPTLACSNGTATCTYRKAYL